jgi:hypothetical protein
LSERVATAAEGGWFAIFFATLTWSLGCAIATYFIIGHRLQAWNAVAAAIVSLLAAWSIAYLLGIGFLDIPEEELVGGSGHPLFRILAVFAFTAFQAYGSYGAIVSGGIGIWIGYRAAQKFPGA